jgi:hypothetical protein
VFLFNDRPPEDAGQNPAPAPDAQATPKPVQPEPVVTAPEPVKPDPDPVVTAPEPVKPDPGPVVSVPEPVQPDPVFTVPGPEKPDLDPEPVNPDPVTSPQPKFDVEAFLAHARSVMAKRCEPEILKHDQELEQNLADFRSNATELVKTNLTENYHEAAGRELDAYVAQRKTDGNRMGKELEKPLIFKKWLVALHEEHQKKEVRIDENLMDSLAGHQNTYLHGLGIRIKALQEDDPAAAELIKAETAKVAAGPEYFVNLMREAIRKD